MFNLLMSRTNFVFCIYHVVHDDDESIFQGDVVPEQVSSQDYLLKEMKRKIGRITLITIEVILNLTVHTTRPLKTNLGGLEME